MKKNSFGGIDKKLILPLISASSVLRFENQFKELLIKSKERKIPLRKVYEAVLQTYLFAGFPSALISLKILNETLPGHYPEPEKLILSLTKKRGVITCKKIYGDKFNKLMENIKTFSPEMSEWLVVEGYGKVLSRKGLSLKERELCIINILAALKFDEQLYSHINGAFNLGVRIDEIKRTISSLEILGNKKLSTQGLLILKRFETQKNKKLPNNQTFLEII